MPFPGPSHFVEEGRNAQSYSHARPVEKVVAERDQLSHGRLIHVVSVFPADGACSPEDKLKTLIDMDLKNSHTVAERGGQTAPSEVTSHKLWTV